MNANSTPVSEAMFAQLRRVLSLGILSPTPTTSAASGNVNGLWSGSAGAATATTGLGSHSQTQHLSPIVSMSLAPSDLNKEGMGDLNANEATERAAAGPAAAPDTMVKEGATALPSLSSLEATEQKASPLATTNEALEMPTLTAGVITPPSQQVSPDHPETAQPSGNTAGDGASVGQPFILSPSAPENSAQPSRDLDQPEKNTGPVVVVVGGQDTRPKEVVAVQQATATAAASEERQLHQQQATQGASDPLNPGTVQPNTHSLQSQPPQVVLSAAGASDAPAFRVPRNSFVVSSGAAVSATIPTTSGI